VSSEQISLIRFSCQTYAWQMSGDTYAGQLPRFVEVASGAGFAGLEAEPFMLREYANISRAHDVIDPSGVELSSVAFVGGWRSRRETEAEREAADHFIRFVSSFPGALLLLVQQPGTDRDNLRERQENAMACVAAIGERAAAAGVRTSFHANSPAGSVFRTRDDYELLLSHLDRGEVGFTPDAGHLARGGMDPLEVIGTYINRVDHVHLKDYSPADGWQITGHGSVDFVAIVDQLRDSGYRGWVVVEDESDMARRDPDAVTRAAGAYVRTVLKPAAECTSAAPQSRESTP
jgi:inosose dehydratase